MDISKHPLLKQAYELCLKIEACGASEELTAAVMAAGDLMNDIEKVIDAQAVNAKDAARFHCWLNLSDAILSEMWDGMAALPDESTDEEVKQYVIGVIDAELLKLN